MRHLLYGGKALLVDDDTASSLLGYAAALARAQTTDTVTFRALGPDGNDVEVTVLLTPGSQLVTETASSAAMAPENPEAVSYMRVHTELLESPPPALPDSDDVDWPEQSPEQSPE